MISLQAQRYLTVPCNPFDDYKLTEGRIARHNGKQ